MKKRNGSITVFLSLVFTFVLSLVCILLESARISSAVTKAEGITNMGLDSCFAQYGKELFEEYGVLFLWKSEEEFLNTYHKVVSLNCNINKDENQKAGDLYGIKLQDTKIETIQNSTDNDGEIFEKQVYEYMFQKLGSDAVKKLVEKSDVLSQGSRVTEFYNRITECNEIFSKAENAVADVKEEIDDLKQIEGNPIENISNIKTKSEELSSLTDEQSALSIREQIKMEYRNYNAWSEPIGKSLQEIQKNISIFKESAKEASANVRNLLEEVEEFRGGFDSEVYGILLEEINDIADKFNEKDGYGINSCETYTNDACAILNRINVSLDEYMEGNLQNPEKTEAALKEAEKFDLSNLSVSIENLSVEKVENKIEEEVDNLIGNGILNLVTEEVSDNKVELSNLPSMSAENKGEKWTTYNIAQETLRKAVFGEYVLTHFGCYTSVRADVPLQYEVEYILEGNASDRENLKPVVEKIMAVRSGFNMISIFKDGIKKKETYTMAASIAGVTGMPLVIKVVQIGIISAWAVAESVVDVRNLLDGRKVALIKSPEQWNLSLTNITSVKSVKKEKDDSGGLSYEDYLRYLLISENKAMQANRTMDMIQICICHKYNEKFRMEECINKVSLISDYQVKKLFTLFVPVGMQKNIYEIQIAQQYEY